MAYSYDGYLRFNTEVDQSGFDKGVNGMKSTAAIGGKAIAVGITAATASITALSAYAISAGANFESAMNTIATSTGATTAEMDGLEESLKNIYADNYGDSFEDIASAISEVKNQTGLAGDELEAMTENAFALRDTFKYEVQESTRAADMMMKQFGITSDEAFNLIAQGSQNGLDKNGNLLDSINEYSVHFQQLGLDSEEMFNMFSNGAESGVFDIDKLGDAVKEFGIRAKDGSNTTIEAYQLLGLNADELQAKFAEGGESANEAFKMVTQTLNGFDDEVIKNIAGVDLFGTMWEDMGAEAVKALTNTNGEFNKTADNLEKIKEIKYDSLSSVLQGIGRQIYDGFQMPMQNAAKVAKESLQDVLTSLNGGQLDKSVDKIADSAGNLLSTTAKLAAEGLPKLINGLALIIDSAPKIIAAMASMATAYGVFKAAVVVDDVVKGWKAATIALDTYRAATLANRNISLLLTSTLSAQQLVVGGLTGKIGLNTVATSLATKAQLAFNASVLANPATWIVGGIAALTVGLLALDQQQSETEKSTIKLNEALEEQRQAREEAEKARQDSMTGAIAEIDHAEDLIKKFDGIVDSNGKIKEGYEGRAQALRDQINSILPDAITLSEKEGDMYLKVADDLGVLIEKKKISALIDANQADYAQAIRDQQDNVNNLRDANEKLAESKANLKKIEEDYANAVADGKIIVDIGPNNLERQRKDAEENVAAMQAQVDEAQLKLQESSKLITDQDNLIAASQSNNIDVMKSALDNMLNTQVDYTNKSKAEMDTQLSNTIGNYQALYRTTLENGGQINDAQFNLLVQSRQNLLTEIDSYLATGEKIPQNLAAGVASTAQEYKNSVDNLLKGNKITFEQYTELMKLTGTDWGNELAGGTESEEVKTKIQTAAEANAFLAMESTKAAWGIENNTSSKGKEIGGYYVDGISVGVSGQDAITKVQTSATLMADALDRATRKALGINSPAKSGIAVGEFYDDGVVVGVVKNKDKVIEAVQSLSDDSIKFAKEKAGSYKELGSFYVDQMKTGINAQRDSLIKQIEKLVDDNTEKHIEALGKDNDKAKTKYREAATELMNTYKKALEAGADEANALMSEKIQGITDEAQKQYDDIIRQRDRMQDKLSDFGDLFTRDEDGKVQLENINKQTDALKRYQAALEGLQDKGISDGLLNEILDLGVEDGTDLAEKLLKNNGVFQRYNEAWTLKQEAAKTIAEQFYADELETLDEDFTQKLDTALASIPEECTNVGVNAIEGVIKGMNDQKGEAVKTARDIADAIIKELKRATETASPSKRAAREVGAPITQGVVKGMKDAYDPQELQSYTDRMMADIGRSQAMATAQSVSYMNSSNMSSSSVYNGGDFILKIEKMVNDGKGSVSSLLQEAEFYRKQKVSATGGA